MSPDGPNAERSVLLRRARRRALERLRVEYDGRYQALLDEEIALAGGAPRAPQWRRDYVPRRKED